MTVRPCDHGYMPGKCSKHKDCRNHKRPRKLGADQQAKADAILRVIGDAWGFDVNSLKGRGRTALLAEARLASYHLMRELGWSWNEIGLALGERDHSVPLKGVDRFRVNMVMSVDLQLKVGRVLAQLLPPGEIPDLQVSA